MVGCWYLSEGPILSGWRRAGSRMSWIRGGFVVRELQQPWLTCRLLFSTSSLPQSKAKHVKLCFHQWEEYLKAARLCLRKVLQGTLFKALCRFSLEMTALWSWGLQVVKIVWLCGGRGDRSACGRVCFPQPWDPRPVLRAGPASEKCCYQDCSSRTSLAVRQLRICLAMQGTWSRN